MVEDDPDITTLLTNYLKLHEMEVDAFPSPDAALDALNAGHYDLIILDLTLPQMDGLVLCRMIREKVDTPIIISSARTDINDKIVALEYGADDYLPKPYEPRELIARIKSVMRRYRPVQESTPSDFELLEQRQVIRFKGRVLELTPAEYEILSLLILHAGRILDRDFLANNAPSISWESSPRTVDVIISRLRQKVEDKPKYPLYIKSLRGRGYRFDG
jgi:two-component system OmpR family response regulator